jgi:hypothetical protein
MDPSLRNKIIDLLYEHRIMTVATNRPDGCFRVVPEVISVLDYSKGFGHTDLVSL